MIVQGYGDQDPALSSKDSVFLSLSSCNIHSFHSLSPCGSDAAGAVCLFLFFNSHTLQNNKQKQTKLWSCDFKTMMEETLEDVVQKHRFLASCLDTWGKDHIDRTYVLFNAEKENGHNCGVEDEHSDLVFYSILCIR